MQPSLSQRDRFKLHRPYSSRNTPDAEEIVIWRWKTLLIISLVLLLTIFYFFLFSPYFKFKSVTSTETLFLPNKDVTLAIDSFLLTNRYIILPQNNYFLISKKELTKLLEDEFKLRKVTILKDAPNGLFIYFKEQISVFVASIPDTQDEIRLFDHTAQKIQTLRKEEYNSELPFVTVGSYKMVNENLATLVLDSWDVINLQNSNFKIIRYIMQEEQLIALTDKNFEIRFSLKAETDLQIRNLEVLKQTFLKGESLPEEYIELRFGEKVFIK